MQTTHYPNSTNHSTSQNDDTSKNSTDQQRELKKKASQQVFNKVNKDENFNDTYVGDVEFKVPTSNLNKDHQIVQEQLGIHPDQSAPTFTSFPDVLATQNEGNKKNDTNQSQNQNFKTSSSASSSANLNETVDHNKNEQNFDINNPNVEKNDQAKNVNDKVEHFEQQKKKLMASHDLDLSTKDFEKDLKKYGEKVASSNVQTQTMETFAPSKEDYYLKDNNSEYNQHLGSKNEAPSNMKNIQEKEKKKSKI